MDLLKHLSSRATENALTVLDLEILPVLAFAVWTLTPGTHRGCKGQQDLGDSKAYCTNNYADCECADKPGTCGVPRSYDQAITRELFMATRR
jgi:hypothetical protein